MRFFRIDAIFFKCCNQFACILKFHMGYFISLLFSECLGIHQNDFDIDLSFFENPHEKGNCQFVYKNIHFLVVYLKY